MPKKLTNYPFTITTHIYLWLKPYSDIDEPDEVVKQLLSSGPHLYCNIEQIDDYSKELTGIRNRLHDIDMWQEAESIVKIIKSPDDASRKEPYLCEVKVHGGFYLKPTIKTEIGEEFIKKVISVGMDDEDMTASIFHYSTNDAYLDYEEILTMAYDSVQVLPNAVFQFGKPVVEERHEG